MKVPLHVVNARRDRLAKLLREQRYISLQEVCKRLGISVATARRDLVALEEEGRITRTHGGALSEFNERFQSYSDRYKKSSKSKDAIARTALQVIQPGGTYFFDGGTTISYLAALLSAKFTGSMKILTVNLPVAEQLAKHRQFEVCLTGGQMLPRQSILLGSGAVRSIEGWNFDAAFLSAEGMNGEGLWNTQLSAIAHQHAVIRRSKRNIFLLDHTKWGHRAAHFLLPWEAVDSLLTDQPRPEILETTIWLANTPMPFPTKLEGAPQNLPVHYL